MTAQIGCQLEGKNEPKKDIKKDELCSSSSSRCP